MEHTCIMCKLFWFTIQNKNDFQEKNKEKQQH